MIQLTRPAAVLTDMDGTLVDTERAWLAVVGRLREDTCGLDAFAGLTIQDAARRLVEEGRRALSYEDTAAWLDREFSASVAAGVRVQPGALRLLDGARALGVPVALVTASERHVAELVVKALGADRFTALVTNGDTPRGKPHPDPYLRAARLLGAAPQDCLAVEDTPTGAAAALAAGCALLAVPSVPGITPGPRTTVVASLAEVTLGRGPR
ncbi:HAD family phosphatase [Streptomyces sp. SID14478]|uniref:HAD family hydrolase n=1 Tax=Streptomyces sp. SID14478 TaxID=2706073 RepID=UPI0013DC9A77|nr:HAD family phosphatase [Streptomyces sp. SID14478]NEB75196.1 HAD family phosphatase [Streptomyces sp. SID14478]